MVPGKSLAPNRPGDGTGPSKQRERRAPQAIKRSDGLRSMRRPGKRRSKRSRRRGRSRWSAGTVSRRGGTSAGRSRSTASSRHGSLQDVANVGDMANVAARALRAGTAGQRQIADEHRETGRLALLAGIGTSDIARHGFPPCGARDGPRHERGEAAADPRRSSEEDPTAPAANQAPQAAIQRPPPL